MIEPNCNMPWEIYLDWLSDQGNDDLRDINPNCFLTSCLSWLLTCEVLNLRDGAGHCENYEFYLYGSGCSLIYNVLYTDGESGYGAGQCNISSIQNDSTGTETRCFWDTF